MSFYNQISSFIEYVSSIRKLENYLSFDMTFPSKWGMPKSVIDENKTIPFEPKDGNFKGVSFVCEINDLEINNIISKINKVIKLNIEREKKELLFKATLEQLKVTFEKNDLGKLQTLYFDFENEQKNLMDDEKDGQESTTIELAGE